MAGLPVNVNGSWKDGKPYVNVNGSWKEVQYAYANVNGSWKQVFANFNKATGGTITDVDNYNGTGEKWRVHEFTYSGSYPSLETTDTLNIEVATHPFSVLIVGGGASGGRTEGSVGSCGGGGYHFYKESINIDPGHYTVTTGGGGWSTNGGPWPDWMTNGNGFHGGSSSIAGIGSANGGSRGTYQSGGSAPGGGNFDCEITGAKVRYGPGGKYGYRTCASLGMGPYGANRGGSGIVIVAYQIG